MHYPFIVLFSKNNHIITYCEYIHNGKIHNNVYNNTYIEIKGEVAIISYRPLWETMEKKGITQYYLLKSGIDNKTLDGLKKNKNVTLLTVEKLCNILNCFPNDIVEFK